MHRLAFRFILLAMLWPLTGCDEEKPPKDLAVTLGAEAFTLELAVTSEQIRKGMMGREMVDDHGGMLFVFGEEQPRRFWMRGCRVNLDILFLDAEGRIVATHTMKVPTEEEKENPPTYPSRWPAQFAIELKEGRIAELKLERGDKVSLPLEKLREWAD